MSTFELRLKEIVESDPTALFDRTRKRVHEMISDCGGGVVLFGAGELGCITLAGLREIGMEPLAFADNNPGLWGRKVNGVPVFSPDDAVSRFTGTAVFVVTIFTSGPPRKQLFDLGVTPISFHELGWAYPRLLPFAGGLGIPGIVAENAADILLAGRLFEDDLSQREYLGQLQWRTSLDFTVLPEHLPSAETYYPHDVVDLRSDEVLVDCGAYDGDSIREFIRRTGGRFEGIAAIEPDPSNLARLMSYLSTLPEEQRAKMTLRSCAVGARKEKLKFNASGTVWSSLGNGESLVECYPLDEFCGGLRPTFIKMDIEGSEIDALLGAERTIREHSPVLAVCAYHRPEDLWRVPLTIRSISDAYRYFVRRYGPGSWEIVCYAVPHDRSRK